MKTLFIISLVVLLLLSPALFLSWLARPELFRKLDAATKIQVSLLRATPEQRLETDKFLAQVLIYLTIAALCLVLISFIFIRWS